MILPRLKEMNNDMIKAAYDLGASQVQMLKEIMLSIWHQLGYCRVFYGFHLLSFSNDFAVTFFVTGNGFSTLLRFTRVLGKEFLEMKMLFQLVFLFSILLVIGYYFISREGGWSMKSSIHF